MKKKITRLFGLALVVALVAAMLCGSIALAADPVVSVDVVSPGGGAVTVTATGTDTSAWNPGATGQINVFNAQGGFTASYDAYAGNYGALSTYVNASSTIGATFTMTDTQDFNILSANHNYNTVGTFTAIASGTTADMNLKSIGSMYCWSEATNPWQGPGLQGTTISKRYDMLTNGNLSATMYTGAAATGGASISNSNIWGWGANENGTITTNYSGGVRSLVAAGSGTYRQYVSAGTSVASSATLNVDSTGVVVQAPLPVGGTVDIIANFVNSLTVNPYTVTAK